MTRTTVWCALFGHKLSGNPYSLLSAFYARCLHKGCDWSHCDMAGYDKARGVSEVEGEK